MIARDNPDVDDGWLCDRGRYGFEMFAAEERVTGPRLRGGGRSSGTRRSRRRAERRSTGRAAGQATQRAIVGDASNEEGYLVQRIVREALGSPHVDSRISRGPGRDALLRLAQPELSAKVRDIDDADAILARRHRPPAQLADPRPAHPQGDAPQRRQAGRRDRPPDDARRRRRGGRPLRTGRTQPPFSRELAQSDVLRGADRDRGPLGRAHRPRGRGRDGRPARPRRRPRPGRQGGQRPARRSRSWPTPAACARPAASPTPARASSPTLTDLAGQTQHSRREHRGDPRGSESGELKTLAPLRRRPPARLPGHRRLATSPRRRRPPRRLLHLRERDDAKWPTSSSRSRPTPRKTAPSPTPTAACSASAPAPRAPATSAPTGASSPSCPWLSATTPASPPSPQPSPLSRCGPVLRRHRRRRDRRPRHPLAGPPRGVARVPSSSTSRR